MIEAAEVTTMALDLPIADYRVRFTVRNNRLLSAIESAGYKSQSDFARAIELRPTAVNALVAMRVAPIGADGEFSPSARVIMEALGACPSDLWAESQLTRTLRKNSGEFEIDHLEVQALLDRNVEVMLLPDPANAVEQRELSEKISWSLSSLTERERKVIQLIYGLEGVSPRTLQEIGDGFGLTKERIRQIQEKALRKLRHPSRSDPLIDAAPEDVFNVAHQRIARRHRVYEGPSRNLPAEPTRPDSEDPFDGVTEKVKVKTLCVQCRTYEGPAAWIHSDGYIGLCINCAKELIDKGALGSTINSLNFATNGEAE